MSRRLSMPRGVPRLPSVPEPARPGLGLGIGLLAAGLTGAAGLAAERFGRERRTALALDSTLDERPFGDSPDSELTVTAADGVELHVEIDEPAGPDDAGEGDDGGARPTVVLCHGFCLSLGCWVFQRRALREAGYRVVLWDQRGHGRSGVGQPEAHDIDHLASDLARVIDAAAPQGPLVLAGHSMGGMTIMGYALDYAERMDRVVGAVFVATSPGGLAHVTYGLGTAAGNLVHRLAPGTTRFLRHRQGLVEASVRLGRDALNLLVDWGSFGSPVPMSVAELTTEMIFGTHMSVIAAFMPQFDRHDKRESLTRFRGIETLVFNGTKDRLTPPEHSEEIVRVVPGAEHVVVRGAGHVIMLEVPDILNDHLLGLLRRIRRHEHAGGRVSVTDVTAPRLAAAGRSRRRRRR